MVNKTKTIGFIVLLVLFLGLIVFLTINYFNDNYKTTTGYVNSIDEYGFLELQDGTILELKGGYLCDNGTYYYYDEFEFLIGKEVTFEYRITEENYKKVEKIIFNGTICEKSGGGYRGTH